MLLAYLYQTLQGSLIEELVAEEEDSPFYQYFDFAGVSSKEEVWIFLKKALIKNLYDSETVVADRSILIGLPRYNYC